MSPHAALIAAKVQAAMHVRRDTPDAVAEVMEGCIMCVGTWPFVYLACDDDVRRRPMHLTFCVCEVGDYGFVLAGFKLHADGTYGLDAVHAKASVGGMTAYVPRDSRWGSVCVHDGAALVSGTPLNSSRAAACVYERHVTRATAADVQLMRDVNAACFSCFTGRAMLV